MACALLSDLLAADDIAGAYAVQALNARAFVDGGRRVAGYKAGLTSPAARRALASDSPIFGRLYADAALHGGEEVPCGPSTPRVEGEIAFVLDRDVTAHAPGPADLMRAIGYVVPAIEVLQSRIDGWNLSLSEIVADNASFGYFVLGGPAMRLDGLDLRGTSMTLSVNGSTVSTGSGTLCMDGPLNAAVWLARRISAEGIALKAGDVVMAGALGPMAQAAPGDTVDVSITGLGAARAVFASQQPGA